MAPLLATITEHGDVEVLRYGCLHFVVTHSLRPRILAIALLHGHHGESTQIVIADRVPIRREGPRVRDLA